MSDPSLSELPFLQTASLKPVSMTMCARVPNFSGATRGDGEMRIWGRWVEFLSMQIKKVPLKEGGTS